VGRSLDILIVVHNPTRQGGAYFRARGLAKPLIRRGHRLTILAIHPTERWRMTEGQLEDFRVVESPDLLPGMGRSGWDPWDTLRRTLWVRKQRFDIIHTIDTRPAVCLPALFGRRAAGARWIADWTDWWGRGGATDERTNQLANKLMGPLEQVFEERPRPYADGTVVISRALGARASALGIPESSQLYLPPGADPQDVRDLTVAEARKELGITEEGPWIGYLGNIYPRDAALLFESLRRMEHRARLVMVGHSGAVVPADLRDRVHLTGRVPFGQMLLHLAACDVLALPMTDSVANRGRWPSKINEYVAVGRPTVVSDVGDVADLVRERDIGLVVEPDPSDFAARLDELLADPARATAMGDRARDLARGEYSQDAVGAKLEQFYLDIIDGPPAA
jgi:glycosyltransferase involved in cell wall biosynthesis